MGAETAENLFLGSGCRRKGFFAKVSACNFPSSCSAVTRPVSPPCGWQSRLAMPMRTGRRWACPYWRAGCCMRAEACLIQTSRKTQKKGRLKTRNGVFRRPSVICCYSCAMISTPASCKACINSGGGLQFSSPMMRRRFGKYAKSATACLPMVKSSSPQPGSKKGNISS